MPSGTITVTNASTTVTGESTTFTTDVSVSDYLLLSTGGITYLLGVISIQSDTSLTLSASFDGPTTSGLTYNVIPQSQLIQVPAQLINQTSKALREMQQNEDNWNQLLTVDGDVTITNPDGTTTTGPSWPAVSKGIDATDLEKAQAIADQTSASADAAATSETNAKASEDAAAKSATDSASSASDSATSAQQSADSASSIGDAVTQSAQNASDASASADRAEAAASVLEDNNDLFNAIDHVDTDTNNVFFKGSIASGAEDASTQLVTISDGTGTITTEIIQTDSSGDDPITKTWTMPDDEGQLITLDDTGISNATDSTVSFKGSVSVGVDASRDAELVTLRQLNSAIAGGGGSNGATLNGVMNNFIGAVMWMNGTRASLPSGYLAADGQTLNRADYPDLWAAVAAGLFVSTEETNWTGSAGSRGYYSDGDGSTTFRLPDLNGRQSASIQGIFLRGDEDGMLPGEIRSSGLPNISGVLGNLGSNLSGGATSSNQGSGVMMWSGVTAPTYAGTGTSPASTGLFDLSFNASRGNGIYQDSISEVRPPSASGMYIIRVSGTFNSSDTNFNVINGNDSLPDSGTVVDGGDLRSVYQVGGVDYATLAMRPRVTVGTGIDGEIRLIDNSSGSPVTKTWTLPTSEGALFGSGQPLSFGSTTSAYQSLTNMGIQGNVNRVMIPVSSTQAYMILSVTAVTSQNTSGDSTITFPNAFSVINSVCLSNGDINVGILVYGIINSIRTSGFDVRAEVWNADPNVLAFQPATGAIRVNYVATGLVNI